MCFDRAEDILATTSHHEVGRLPVTEGHDLIGMVAPATLRVPSDLPVSTLGRGVVGGQVSARRNVNGSRPIG